MILTEKHRAAVAQIADCIEAGAIVARDPAATAARLRYFAKHGRTPPASADRPPEGVGD